MTRSELGKSLGGALRPWLILALVCAGFSLNPTFLRTFWTADYLPMLMQQAATNIILAVGMTFVIITGGIDLSVGSVLALSGVALGMTINGGPPPFITYIVALPFGVLAGAQANRLLKERNRLSSSVGSIGAAVATILVAALIIQQGTSGGIRVEGAILAALAVGLACGLVNGLVITLGGVPPFVVTLGMLTAARGLSVFATKGMSISSLPSRLATLGNGVPLIVLSLAVVAVGAIILTRTKSGRYMVAIGGNEQAARLTGVNVTLYKSMAYALAGLASAIAAVVLVAKFRSADSTYGMGYELNAIAAVVIGGASLSGGQGSVIGSLVGALTIAVLNAGLVLIQVPDTMQGVVIGAVIVFTVMIDQYRKGSRRSIYQ